jgi:nondiscriminating glutamyl-tRNA synthetase
MITLQKPRVRFAPAPTGMMHLGNIRTALMNYLLAHQKQGTFVLRVEDTDLERNFDPGAEKIKEDLAWLGITYDEGPGKEQPSMAPYFQSQRNHIYQQELQSFIRKGFVYRCFCSAEELEKKRQRQIALKQPPRYDGVCTTLSQQESDTKAQHAPFIWRMKIDHTKTVTIHDLSHGPVVFDLKNFSDFPISRQDGSVTFMFANFIDDVLMKIDCVIRGEDHLSNTAGQAAMYLAYGAKLPLFWHMPILCSIDGKKLSKRDFGFSLRDLKDAGFLPEAIINYLAIIGGSYKNEIMSKEELIAAMNFEHLSTTGQIKYDVEKLRWVNHKWIARLSLDEITTRCLPYLHEAYPATKTLENTTIKKAVACVHQEMVTLHDCVTLLAFYFDAPVYEPGRTHTLAPTEKLATLCTIVKTALTEPTLEQFLDVAKKSASTTTVTPKELFSFIRYGLTGSPTGIGIAQLGELLTYETLQKRLIPFLSLVQ